MSEEPRAQDGGQGDAVPSDWEERDDLDVGAPTGQWRAYRREHDTSELLRRELHSRGTSRTAPSVTLLLAAAAVTVLVLFGLYVLLR